MKTYIKPSCNIYIVETLGTLLAGFSPTSKNVPLKGTSKGKVNNKTEPGLEQLAKGMTFEDSSFKGGDSFGSKSFWND